MLIDRSPVCFVHCGINSDSPEQVLGLAHFVSMELLLLVRS